MDLDSIATEAADIGHQVGDFFAGVPNGASTPDATEAPGGGMDLGVEPGDPAHEWDENSPAGPPQAQGEPQPDPQPELGNDAGPSYAAAVQQLKEQNDNLHGQAALLLGMSAQDSGHPFSDEELAARYHTTPPVIAARRQEFQQRCVAETARVLLSGAPVLQKHIVAGAAPIVQDDVHNAAQIERTLTEPRGLLPDSLVGIQHTGLKTIGAFLRPGFGMNSGMPLGNAIDPKTGKLGWLDKAGNVVSYSDMLNRAGSNPDAPRLPYVGEIAAEGKELQELAMQPEYTPQRWTGNVTSGLTYALAGRFAPFVAGISEGSAASQKLKDHNVDDNTADVAGFAEGSAQGIAQLFPMGRVLFGKGATTLAKTAASSTAKAAAVGAAQSVAGDEAASRILAASGYEAQAKDVAPTTDKAMDAALFMGGFHIGMQGAHGLMQRTAKSLLDTDKVLNAADLAAQSKFRERDQQAFRDWLKEVTEHENAPKNVYVDAHVFAQSMEKAGVPLDHVESIIPGMGKEVREAVREKRFIRFSVADYLAYIAGGEMDADLRPHLRIDDPDAPSKAEQDAFFRDGAPGDLHPLFDAEQWGKYQKELQAMSAEDRAIAERFAGKLRNYDAAVAEYSSIPDTQGGKVLNTDLARELCPDYLKDRTKSEVIQRLSSVLVRKMFLDKLATTKGPMVLFSAGGPGSGKSTVLESHAALANKADIVYDTTMSHYASAMDMIEQVLKAGGEAHVVLVIREPTDALLNGVVRRAVEEEKKYGSGRTVALDYFLDAHPNAIKNVFRLAEEYRNDPDVQFTYIDNTNGMGNTKEVSLELAKKIEFQQVEERARNILEQEYRNGKISTKIYTGIKQGVHVTGRTR